MARDDWQGVDLTTAVENVVRQDYERRRSEAAGRGFTGIPEWEALDAVQKQTLKQGHIPLITAAIDEALSQWDSQAKGLLRRLLDDLDSTLSEHELALENREHAGVADRHAISEVKALVADARNDYREV